MIDERFVTSAKNGTKRAGQKDLLNHLAGKRLTQRQAIKAKCYDCGGMGEDDTCEIEECGLFPFSPYNALCKRSRQKRQKKGKLVAQKEKNAGSATFIEAPAVEKASGGRMAE